MDNLLTYKGKSGLSNYSVLLGQSSRIERENNLYGSAINVPGYDDQAKYLVNGSATNRNAWDGGSRYQGLSFFTRATWNYNEKYLATATFRADGSSKYQDKWGYFPSLGLGWVMSSEPFIQNLNRFDYLKLRASWGMLGNDNIPANSTYILGESGTSSSGIFGDKLVDGVGAQTVYQNYLKWEVVNEFDLGVDFALKGNVWRGEIDYYHRTTNNVVFYAPIATGGGVAQLLGNNGSVLNSGFEVAIHYNKDLNKNSSLGISLNATTIHNEVTELNNRDYIPSGMVRGNYTTRTQVGHPIGSFYGYEIDGVYASETEALQDPVSQIIKDKGFFKYKDQNGDKVITEADKVFLGSPIPKVMTGLDVVYTYGKFDASMAIQGQFGNKVLNAKRMNRDVFVDGNYDKDFYDNRWTTSNKSNKYPSAEAYNSSFIQQANTFFVESAWYIRIQNIQVGYNLKNIPNISLLRFYIAAQRPFTYFTYNGFTPEVGGDPINSGIDTSVYPMQAIYTVGAKINF
jgi:TonB-linked SusC/RagA family outer membrane protein